MIKIQSMPKSKLSWDHMIFTSGGPEQPLKKAKSSTVGYLWNQTIDNKKATILNRLKGPCVFVGDHYNDLRAVEQIKQLHPELRANLVVVAVHPNCPLAQIADVVLGHHRQNTHPLKQLAWLVNACRLTERPILATLAWFLYMLVALILVNGGLLPWWLKFWSDHRRRHDGYFKFLHI